MAAARKRPSHTDRFGEAPGKSQRFRMRFVRFLFLFVFAVIAARLVQLQVDPGMEFTEEDLRHVGMIQIPAPRGNIYDRAGQLLATEAKVPSLCANPQDIENPDEVARILASRLGLDPKEIYDRLASEHKQFVFVKRWLEPDEVAALGDMKEWAGDELWFNYEPVRSYPQDDLAAHVLGFVNREQVGSAGIEMAYDEELRSTPGVRRARKDAKGRLIGTRTVEYEEPEGGANLHLTIDAVIQSNLEQALDRRVEETEALRGMGVVMDPKTGAILALASRPSYNPNTYWDYDLEAQKNHAITDVFEPGSAFKIVAAAAALELDLITPETEFDCEDGAMYIGRRRIRDSHPMGIEPFTMCFAESSNIAIIKVAALLGPERFEQWIKNFGFGERTCPDLPGESPGIFRPLSQWSGYSMGSLPMGQEISVTMLQLARSFAVIANGGMLVEPYVVDKVVSREGRTLFEHDSGTARRILSESTAATMRALCHQVVTMGTGDEANIDNYRVGGKTGTAQVAKTDGRGYAKGKYTTVFAGFAPLADPRLCAVIVIQEPQTWPVYGGPICGPVFKEVVNDGLRYLHVPEDPVLTKVAANRANDLDADILAQEFSTAELDELLSDDWLDPMADLNVLPESAGAAASGPALPDLRGMTKREALLKLERLGVKWDAQGAGWVRQQDPAPGTALTDVTLCRLIFGGNTTARAAVAGEDEITATGNTGGD